MKNVVLATYKNLMILLVLMMINSIVLFAQDNIKSAKDSTPQFLYGIASWYNDDFTGKITASGEKYSPDALTAAHRSLPFGTRIQVENLSNGKKVELIINDRGPFVQNRILEVSKQAADILGFLNDGTSFVKVTIMELGASLPTPIGLPSVPIGKDIPQNFGVTNEVTNTNDIATNNHVAYHLQNNTTEAVADDLNDLDNLDNVDDLFTEDELDFMDDGFDDLLASQEPQARSQELEQFSDTAPAKPRGFLANTNEFLINDPLSNMVLGPEDEFVPAPATPDEVLDTAPHPITPEEKRLLNQAKDPDPFADLFNDAADPYQFQEEVADSTTLPINSEQEAQNIGSSDLGRIPTTNKQKYFDYPTNDYQAMMPPINNDEPHYMTNTMVTNPQVVIITNYVAAPPTTNATNMFRIPDPVTPPIVPQKMGDHYVIQLGAFSKQKNALNLYEKLRNSGFNAFITDVKIKGKNLIRVRVGYFDSIDEAAVSAQRLEEEYHLNNRIIKVEYDDQ